tara:strand:+ start:129 stop:344 length:216 start_codon:yes stop_codon:yes gene_type:complete
MMPSMEQQGGNGSDRGGNEAVGEKIIINTYDAKVDPQTPTGALRGKGRWPVRVFDASFASRALKIADMSRV